MAGTITSLKFQKRTADRVNVYLDGKYALALPALTAAHLRVGQYLDDAMLAELRAEDTRQKAYDRALHFLSYRPRSGGELQRHLADAGFEPDVVQEALARLAAQGYLNDAEFAQFWVENRQRFRPKGARALRQELRQRGLDADTIAAALDGLDAAEDAYQAASPRARQLAGLARTDPADFRRKMSAFLLRRGFDYDVSAEAVNRLLRELTEDMLPE